MTVGSSPELRAWLVKRLAHLVPEFPDQISDDTSLVDEGLCFDSIKIMTRVEWENGTTAPGAAPARGVGRTGRVGR